MSRAEHHQQLAFHTDRLREFKRQRSDGYGECPRRERRVRGAPSGRKHQSRADLRRRARRELNRVHRELAARRERAQPYYASRARLSLIVMARQRLTLEGLRQHGERYAIHGRARLASQPRLRVHVKARRQGGNHISTQNLRCGTDPKTNGSSQRGGVDSIVLDAHVALLLIARRTRETASLGLQLAGFVNASRTGPLSSMSIIF